jgi:signal transduction histidine kinase
VRLAEFITREIEIILERWEAFASTRLPAAGYMKPLELRDHARQILEAVVIDLSTPQTKQEQVAKSMGLSAGLFPTAETAAQTHAILRARSGFDINQLASEYRALRASVLHLWAEACVLDRPQLEDVMRFNEAIDQALAESIALFNVQVEQSRNLLLGMLGHDMRSPLQTIRMTAMHLARLNAGDDISKAARRLINSGAQMHGLLDDLLDFNRTQLGLGISITPGDVDLGVLCEEEVEQLRAGHPGHEVQLVVFGDCHGCWDGKRLRQLLGNLTVNAIKYGQANKPIRVSVIGRETDVRIEVRNEGPAIPRATLAQMFQPLKRGLDEPSQSDGSLGLGLYIASEIAKAHGGGIDARSEDTETVFSVSVPRRLACGPSARS